MQSSDTCKTIISRTTTSILRRCVFRIIRGCVTTSKGPSGPKARNLCLAILLCPPFGLIALAATIAASPRWQTSSLEGGRSYVSFESDSGTFVKKPRAGHNLSDGHMDIESGGSPTSIRYRSLERPEAQDTVRPYTIPDTCVIVEIVGREIEIVKDYIIVYSTMYSK